MYAQFRCSDKIKYRCLPKALEAPDVLRAEAPLMRTKRSPTQDVKIVGEPVVIELRLRERCPISALLAVELVKTTETDWKYIVVLGEALMMSLHVLAATAVGLMGFGTSAAVVMVLVEIELEQWK